MLLVRHCSGSRATLLTLVCAQGVVATVLAAGFTNVGKALQACAE